ncbi:unnamed protein product [Cylicocyclus nassatus]|uniref:Uncharacterized protein n=1 Tax=Cylicocyclus nassatus TaxID=53992 RepID=A0AA36GLB5_CYLNA|nr:unnamed protein product [Cylicocyclus nassatus]
MWKGMKQHYNRFKIKYSGSTAQTADPLVRKPSLMDNAAAPSERLTQSSQPSSVARTSSNGSSRKRNKLLAEDELNAVRSATNAVWDRLSEDVESVSSKYSTFGAFAGAASNDLPKAIADEEMQLLFNVLTTGADAYGVSERGEEPVGHSGRYGFPEDVEVMGREEEICDRTRMAGFDGQATGRGE